MNRTVFLFLYTFVFVLCFRLIISVRENRSVFLFFARHQRNIYFTLTNITNNLYTFLFEIARSHTTLIAYFSVPLMQLHDAHKPFLLAAKGDNSFFSSRFLPFIHNTINHNNYAIFIYLFDTHHCITIILYDGLFICNTNSYHLMGHTQKQKGELKKKLKTINKMI